jgi:hypothetical protein
MKVNKEEKFIEIKNYIENCGGKLLSDKYVDSKTKLEYVCAFCGSASEATYTQIRQSSTNCQNCRYERSSIALGKRYDDVYKFYESRGCKLISKEYKNNKSVLEFVCKCGNKDKKSYVKFQRNPQCRVCGVKPIDEYHDLFEMHGCKIMHYDEYKGRQTVVTFLCKCGNVDTKKISNYVLHPNCTECGNKLRADANTFTISDVEAFVEKNSDCALLSTEYNKYSDELKFLCKCGNEFTTTFGYFKYENKRQCDECGLNSRIGENHHNWKGGVTPENYRARATMSYFNWRNNVYKRDNYTCQKCGDNKGGNLQAHHILNFSEYEELRYDVDNGITLCEDCHSKGANSFHSIYGTRNNTKEQLEEFLERKL